MAVILNNIEASGPISNGRVLNLQLSSAYNLLEAKTGIRANPLEPPLPTGLIVLPSILT